MVRWNIRGIANNVAFLRHFSSKRTILLMIKCLIACVTTEPNTSIIIFFISIRNTIRKCFRFRMHATMCSILHLISLDLNSIFKGFLFYFPGTWTNFRSCRNYSARTTCQARWAFKAESMIYDHLPKSVASSIIQRNAICKIEQMDYIMRFKLQVYL